MQNSTTIECGKRSDIQMPCIKRYGEELLEAVELLESSNPEDAFSLIKKIEKESRGELGTGSIEFFSRPQFIQSIINIGHKYTADEKVLEYVIRVLKTITERCGKEIQENQEVKEIHEVKTQNVYDFLFKHKDSVNKKIKMLVAYAIPFFPQFDNYEEKWEYIMLTPRIAPKEKSIQVLRWIIESRIGDVPKELRKELIDIFQDNMNKQIIHPVYFHRYLALIEQLKMED